MRSYERRLILRALEASGGVQKHAAELLKVKPTTLRTTQASDPNRPLTSRGWKVGVTSPQNVALRARFDRRFWSGSFSTDTGQAGVKG